MPFTNNCRKLKWLKVKHLINCDSPDKCDMAILHIYNPIVEFNERVRPICLPTVDQTMPKEGSLVYVAGYGKEGADLARSEYLKEGEMRLVSNSACLELPHPDAFQCATPLTGAVCYVSVNKSVWSYLCECV